ncbi:CoA-binding protein [Rhodococcus sovatensis]|uniref:CoA-binding protein n=1 Tax=Rhodococcus sovatensis TaxID=1805840 RepID=UPI003BB1B509
MTVRSWDGPSAQQRQRILRETKTVAIVGASKNPSRASYFVNRYLSSTSHYEIFLVNPTVSEIEGVTVYPTLSDLPKAPDLVDVFRKYDDLPAVLEEAREVKATTIWLQLDIPGP